MFTRLLKRPERSVFLFGPRGTGKSTWLRGVFADKAVFYNLLDTSEALRLSRRPALLFEEAADLPQRAWVVVDEIQKVPALLNEVHRLIEERGLNFVLCGSSARKLKEGGVNLLAGRAGLLHMFPLVSAEVGFHININRHVRYGMLPMAYDHPRPEEFLRAYAETYLQEEIKAEALTRNIGSFSRFLDAAARQNAQLTNVSAIARDAEVARQTVQSYFDILVDTLAGVWLPAWKLKRSTKQVAHPKFYFFDPGVARALSGRLPYPPLPEEMGALLETLVLNEVRAYLSYSGLHYPLYFWRSPDGVEVDLLFESAKGYVALEIKSASRWERAYGRGLRRLQEELGANKVRCFGIFTGRRALSAHNIQVLPVLDFLERLWDGAVAS